MPNNILLKSLLLGANFHDYQKHHLTICSGIDGVIYEMNGSEMRVLFY